MKSNESTRFVSAHRYALEYKSANMSAIMKDLDKKVKDGQIRIKKSNNKPFHTISDSVSKQFHIKELLTEPMIKIFLSHKGYSKMTDNEENNWISFDNGKTSIEIFAGYRDYFPCKYEFVEHYENEDIVSKGCFPIKSSGINHRQFDDYGDSRNYFYFLEPNYNGSEYFKQAFMYDNKLATISLIVKKIAEHPSWCCTYPEFSVSIVVGYYDLDNNVSLKAYRNDAMLTEDISSVGSILSSKAIPNSTDTISVIPSVYGGGHWDASFFSSRIKEFQEPIQKGLSKAYKKVERYFGTKLEPKEKLGFVKKIIPTKSK